jgi:hypothetical protein
MWNELMRMKFGTRAGAGGGDRRGVMFYTQIGQNAVKVHDELSSTIDARSK